MPRIAHLYLSVFPLGSGELARVMAAVRGTWVSPSWVSRRDLGGAWLFQAQMEAPLPQGQDLNTFAEQLSIAVWQRLGRYVKLVVDVRMSESDEIERRELNRGDYQKLMRAH